MTDTDMLFKKMLIGTRQIIFNAEMSRLVNSGAKTETRRVVPLNKRDRDRFRLDGFDGAFAKFEYAKYRVGDRLWLREPVKILSISHDGLDMTFQYLSDGATATIPVPDRYVCNENYPEEPKWLFAGRGVPNGCLKEMSRTILEVTDVRVERLSDIDYDGMQKEGYQETAMNSVAGLMWFTKIWDATTKSDNNFKDDPYVFVYTFKIVHKKMGIEQ